MITMEQTNIETSQIQVPEAPIKKESSPIWLGIKLLFVDMGISGALGAIAGLVMGAAGMSAEAIEASPVLIGAGFLVSLYAAFLLYRQYSKNIKALLAMIGAAFLLLILLVYTEISAETSTLLRESIMGVAQILTFVFGWYLAKTTDIRIFLLPKKWVTGFFIVGIIVAFIAFLGAIAIIAA